MTKTLTMTSALALVLFAGHASAQELTYGAGTLDYTLLEEGGDQYNTLRLEGDLEITYDQFLLGGSAGYQSLETSGSASVNTYDAFVGYMPTSTLLFGAGVNGLAIEGDDSYSGYEAFAQFDNGQYGVAVRYERPLGQDDDLAVTSLFGRAALTPELAVGAVLDSLSDEDEMIYYISADYDSGPVSARGFYHGVTEVDVSTFGVRGSYQVNQGFFATADFQQTEGFLGDDLSIYSVGGGYRISDTAYVDAAVGQLRGDGGEANMLRVGLTFETGNRKRLDASMSDAIRADFANGLGALVPDLGVGSGIFIN